MAEAAPGPEGVAARRTRLLVRGEGAERIAYYSDAVFAIAMTLLIVDLRIPESATSALEVLQDEWQPYLSFALSFAIVGYVWVGHHRRFRVIVRHDTGLMVINLVLLFLVASVPFPTSLIGEFAPETAAVVSYAAVMGLIPIAELAEWWYARRAGLLAEEVDPALFRYIAWDFLPIPLVFGASIVVALVFGGDVGMYTWFSLCVIGPVQGVLSARRIDRASARPR